MFEVQNMHQRAHKAALILWEMHMRELDKERPLPCALGAFSDAKPYSQYLNRFLEIEDY